MRVPLPPDFLRLPLTHRTLHNRAAGIIENSISGARAAVAAGYGIEIDVQLSSDGRVVVFHDGSLARVTGRRGRVSARTAAELAQIPLKDGGGEGIPAFADLLAAVGGRVPLLVELKDPTDAMTETDGRLEAAVAEALRGYDGPVGLMSFNPHCVAHLARLAPHLPRGLTTAAYDAISGLKCARADRSRLRRIGDYDHVEASFISHEVRDLGRPRVAELKAAGATILCWTVRSPAQEAQARRVADNVTFEGYAAAFPG